MTTIVIYAKEDRDVATAEVLVPILRRHNRILSSLSSLGKPWIFCVRWTLIHWVHRGRRRQARVIRPTRHGPVTSAQKPWRLLPAIRNEKSKCWKAGMFCDLVIVWWVNMKITGMILLLQINKQKRCSIYNRGRKSSWRETLWSPAAVQGTGSNAIFYHLYEITKLSTSPVQSYMGIEYREHGEVPEAYTCLLLDVFQVNQSNFLRDDKLIAAWELITPS